MQNGGAPSFIEGLNKPRDSQNEYHFCSIERGSKLFASSMAEQWAQTANYSGLRPCSRAPTPGPAASGIIWWEKRPVPRRSCGRARRLDRL